MGQAGFLNVAGRPRDRTREGMPECLPDKPFGNLQQDLVAEGVVSTWDWRPEVKRVTQVSMAPGNRSTVSERKCTTKRHRPAYMSAPMVQGECSSDGCSRRHCGGSGEAFG